MRSLVGFLIDLSLLLLAIVGAFLLRENFELSVARLIHTIPYFTATAIAAVLVLPVSGINRSIWRMSSMSNYVRIFQAITVVIIAAVALTFAYNRMTGVVRSLPILHGILATCLLIGARVLMRLRYLARQTRKTAIAPMKIVADTPVLSVLVVGISRLTEIYLQSIAELASGRFEVIGILGRSNRHVGRLVGSNKVLGLSEDIEGVVQDLEVHGQFVNRIIVTTAYSALSLETRSALRRIKQSGSIELQFLCERLGLESEPHISSDKAARFTDPSQEHPGFEIAPDDITAMGRRNYWKVKRFGDFIGAAILLLVLLPVMLLVGTLVAMTIGFPVTFWQQRPGLGGRPFRLLKFRSMASAYTSAGQRLSDKARISLVGNFLRRTRLDELPQLFNILNGDMSFVGPRPLLGRDQSKACFARLLVRPGLTGWAQVVGGRIISAEDKAALDVWYVKNASLWLDLLILARTVPIVVFGERTAEALIKRAWFELREAGILRGEMAHIGNES